MIRRLPLFATLVVLACVGVMVALGLWQLRRAEWKENLLARYAAAADAPPLVWPMERADVESSLYRRSQLDCSAVKGVSSIAGRNAQGGSGQAHVARCVLAGGAEVEVVLGWSANPSSPAWEGGPVAGMIGPGRGGAARLIADPPLAGLAAHALPDPAAMPNNHLSYAVQWFLFAAVAMVIYGLALAKRLAGARTPG